MCMCNHPGVFHTGISWKPVTDWRNYWGQLYGRAFDQAGGRPGGLQGHLAGNSTPRGWRVISWSFTGCRTTTLLFQDAVWMIQKMIEAGKYFDLMVYPRDDHGSDAQTREAWPDCMERFACVL